MEVYCKDKIDRLGPIDKILEETKWNPEAWWKVLLHFSSESDVDEYVRCYGDINKTFILHLPLLPMPVYERALQCGYNPNLKDGRGNTVLHMLIRNNINPADACAKMDLLIRYGAQYDIQNNDGLTPSMYYLNYIDNSGIQTKLGRKMILSHLTLIIKKQTLFGQMMLWFEQYIMANMFGHIQEPLFDD